MQLITHTHVTTALNRAPYQWFYRNTGYRNESNAKCFIISKSLTDWNKGFSALSSHVHVATWIASYYCNCMEYIAGSFMVSVNHIHVFGKLCS